MFKNAGSKLQGLAIVIFVLFIIAGAIIGNALSKNGELIIVFVIVSIPLGWVCSITLYAFGELCENVQTIAGKNNSSKPSGNDSIPKYALKPPKNI